MSASKSMPFSVLVRNDAKFHRIYAKIIGNSVRTYLSCIRYRNSTNSGRLQGCTLAIRASYSTHEWTHVNWANANKITTNQLWIAHPSVFDNSGYLWQFRNDVGNGITCVSIASQLEDLPPICIDCRQLLSKGDNFSGKMVFRFFTCMAYYPLSSSKWSLKTAEIWHS